jgi:hypothetical protein
MVHVPFVVDDGILRSDFLRKTAFDALESLGANDRARWGRMTAQQMVEHLVWAMEASTGAVALRCDLPGKLIERFKTFLHNNTPTSHDFMNPLLKSGLPTLRFAGISEAIRRLRDQTDLFLQQEQNDDKELRVHPVFGPLDHEEWSRSHFKHFYHHLLQFGLIAESKDQTGLPPS